MIDDPDEVVVEVSGDIDVVFVETEGPQGPPGAVGDAYTITATAATALGGHRVVRASQDGVRIARSTAASDAGLVIGITTSAVEAGQPAQLQASGPMVEPSWSWVPGPVFLGANGSLTQVPSSGAFEQQVAVAVTATRIIVRIDPPLLLAS